MYQEYPFIGVPTSANPRYIPFSRKISNFLLIQDMYRNETLNKDGVHVDQLFITSWNEKIYVTYAYHNFVFVLYCTYKADSTTHNMCYRRLGKNVKTGTLRFAPYSHKDAWKRFLR
jgi:hypothetical protein